MIISVHIKVDTVTQVCIQTGLLKESSKRALQIAYM